MTTVDQPNVFFSRLSTYVRNAEEKYKTHQKIDKTGLDKPHIKQNETHQFYYSSPVKNSHQFPNEKKIYPPLFAHEIKPHSSQLLKDIDNNPQYVGHKKYTTKTLPYKFQPEWK